MMLTSLENEPTNDSRAATRARKRKAWTPWASVEKGQDVVLEKGNERFAGIIDELTDDGAIVWITSSTGERRLFHVSDGYGLLLYTT
jgi:hypothetical protein